MIAGPMLLLIDEDVPESVVEFLRERGHEILYARNLTGSGAKDPVVARIGDEATAIIVTWNQKDFKRLAARIPEENFQRFRRLGRISFTCRHSRGRARIEEVIDHIELLYQASLARRDKRLLIEVHQTAIKVVM